MTYPMLQITIKAPTKARNFFEEGSSIISRRRFEKSDQKVVLKIVGLKLAVAR